MKGPGFEFKKSGWVGGKQECLWLRDLNVQRKDLDWQQAKFSSKELNSKYFRLCSLGGEIEDFVGTYITREKTNFHKVLLMKFKIQ